MRRPFLPFFFACTSLLVCLLMARGSFAQEPRLLTVQPAGGERGAAQTWQIRGTHLQESKIWFSGKGIQVENVTANAAGDLLTVRAKIAADAPLGPRELRVSTPQGVSNAARLWIDLFPDTSETEPNDDFASAQSLGLTPTVLNGAIQSPGDRDVFTFQTAPNETWVFDANAARLRSPLLPVLELYGESGQKLRSVTAVERSSGRDNADPRLTYTFARGGRYYLVIRDAENRGGVDFVYRLTLGSIPALTTFQPHGERPGRRVGLDLEGVNLARRTAIVTIPTETNGGEIWTSLDTDRGPSLPFPLIVDSLPTAGVTESDATMPLPPFPIAMDGSFQKYSRIRFSFRAVPTDHLVFELIGRRLGSPVIGDLQVLDAAGKRLMASDDASSLTGEARLEFTPPVSGNYILQARNRDGTLGADHAYRLEARSEAEPDMRLWLDTDRAVVPAGSSITLTVHIKRTPGFEGGVTLRADGLPAGVTLAPATIPAAQSRAELTLTATTETKPGGVPLRFTATATAAGKTLTRSVIARETYSPRTVDAPNAPPRYRITELFMLGVIPSKSAP